MKAQAGNCATSSSESNPFLFGILKRRKHPQIIYAICLAQNLRVSDGPVGPLVVNYLIYRT